MNETKCNALVFGVFCGLFTLVFTAGKIWGLLEWSWWWVLSPIWVPAAVVIFLMVAVCVVAVIKTKG